MDGSVQTSVRASVPPKSATTSWTVFIGYRSRYLFASGVSSVPRTKTLGELEDGNAKVYLARLDRYQGKATTTSARKPPAATSHRRLCFFAGSEWANAEM